MHYKDLVRKKIKFRNKIYTVMSARLGRKNTLIEMTDDKNSILTLTCRTLDSIEIVGDADKDVIKEAQKKRYESEIKEKTRHTNRVWKWIEMKPETGDTAMIRFKSQYGKYGNPIVKGIRINRVTELGFYDEQKNYNRKKGGYYKGEYVEEIIKDLRIGKHLFKVHINNKGEAFFPNTVENDLGKVRAVLSLYNIKYEETEGGRNILIKDWLAAERYKRLGGYAY